MKAERKAKIVGLFRNIPYLCRMYAYYDNQLGNILIKPNVRAKNIIARRREGEIHLTVPHGFDFKRVPGVLDEMRPRLIKMAVATEPLITEESVINTFTFQARISRTDKMKNVQMRFRDGELMIFIPDGLDLTGGQLQHTVKEIIRRLLRHEAKRVLPQKVVFWARKFNLPFNQVKINKSTTRWGSCSHQKNINLSFYLMLLPEKLIDYVVLHELAHTVEMNHGEKFWDLLSKLCQEDARAISRSVRKFNSPDYNLIKP